jgi:protoheme IX farnesyltransferase
MADTAVATAAPSRAQDLVQLTKPSITLMVTLTAAVGFVAGSPEHVDYLTFLHATVGTGLLAAGASALNQVIERDTDGLMRRTAARPLPAGRLAVEPALRFGALMGLAGLVYLVFAVNLLTALLGAVTLASYVWVYTPLKKMSGISTLVGAVPGALPPVMGWAAARNAVDAPAVVLFAILFLWQLPHFLAIAWLYRADYERGGFPMLSTRDPDGMRTGRQMILYCAALLPVSLLPAVLGGAGGIYLATAVAGGLAFLASCLAFVRTVGARSARRVLLVSVAYLPVLLLALVLDRIPMRAAAQAPTLPSASVPAP